MGTDQTLGPDPRAGQDGSVHPDHGPITNLGAADYGAVPHGYAVANFHGDAPIAVDDRAILNIDAPADNDLALVSPNHCVKPNARTFSYFDVTRHHRPFGQKYRGMKPGVH
jgi:hypothetical protein